MNRIKLITIVLLVSIVVPTQAVVKPSSLFSDNVILQRSMSVPVWGTADDGENVTVEIQGQKVSTTAKEGKWMVRLQPLKEGGPYTMIISGSNKIELKNILVGEVWIASGQSNMAMPLNLAEHGSDDVASSADPMLRLTTVPRIPSRVPLSDTGIKWVECGPDAAGDFSAVAYYFGRHLRKVLGCPVGLLDASRGGTRIQPWMEIGSLKPYINPDNPRDMKRGQDAGINEPSTLYNGVIAPLVPFAIRGVIWYQGESNAEDAWLYRKLFPAMISNWRSAWGQGDFPFLFVQLAPHMKIVTEPQESQWAELRESQLLTLRAVTNTAMAVITDYGDPENIHPTHKQPVGDRLALAARALAYGENVTFKGPAYKLMTIRGSEAVIEFDNACCGLIAKDGEPAGFTIAGEDKKFYNAKAVIQLNKVIVSSPEVAKPAAVRYGWADCPVVNLFNTAGLPASPFRTDNFPLTTMPKVK